MRLPDGTHRIIGSDIFERADSMLGNVRDKDLPTDIPRDPQLFYEDFGFIKHPHKRDKNGHALPVLKLAPYQYEFWNYPGKILAVKSNKIGLSTTAKLECFHKSILPEYAGTQIIIAAQDQNMANQHLLELKTMIDNSVKYRDYLITNPQTELFNEQKSKMSIAYIANPYYPKNPTTIIALGQSPGRTYSWTNVSHILMSDISKMTRKDWESYWSGMYTRIANTAGTIKIESIPSGKQGLVWQLFKQLTLNKHEAETDLEKDTFIDDPEKMLPTFKLMTITYREAVAAGVISPEYMAEVRQNMPEWKFREVHECEFLSGGNQWYSDEDITSTGYGIV